MQLPYDVTTLAHSQWGVVTRGQLLESRVTEGQIRAALGKRWRYVLPGVVLLQPDAPTEHQRLMAAQLRGGPDSWICGTTAGALHGLPGCTVEPPIQVYVPAPQRPRPLGFVTFNRTGLTGERLVQRGPLRLSCISRALVDAAADAPTRDVTRSLIVDAVHQRRVRVDDVEHWIEARRPNGRLLLRSALAEAVAGSWLIPEADLARLIGTSALLPRPWLNPTLVDAAGRRLTTPDLWLDDVAMAIMVHSRQFHGGVMDWEATVNDDSDLQLAGVIVVGVTPTELARQPRAVLARLEYAYQAATRRRRPTGPVATPKQRTWRSA